MSKLVHRIYIGTFVLIVLYAMLYLSYRGYDYYQTALEERYFHLDHDWLKASGPFGHGLGIIGTLMIVIGVAMYMIRKRVKKFHKLGVLKHWLEFHIFLCSLGPVLVLFHTSFKFGGVVSVSFWSMVAVVASGVLGRFIYLQIPHTIQGRALSLDEVKEMASTYTSELSALNAQEALEINKLLTPLDNPPENISFLDLYVLQRRTLKSIKLQLASYNLSKTSRKRVWMMYKNQVNLKRKIARLEWMKKLFAYWHVAHLPFAIIMLVIMVIHVLVTIAFGYRWIF